jgi:hypothetical protein
LSKPADLIRRWVKRQLKIFWDGTRQIDRSVSYKSLHIPLRFIKKSILNKGHGLTGVFGLVRPQQNMKETNWFGKFFHIKGVNSMPAVNLLELVREDTYKVVYI